MNIVIPTIGTRGDVQPFIALAQGLVASGHTLTLASHPVMKNLVESHGVSFAPIGPDIDLGEEVAAIRQHSRNIAIGLMRGMRFSFDMLEKSHADILAECRKADLVVVPAASAAGKNEADRLQVPYMSVSFMPWSIPWDDPSRPLVKRIAYGLIDAVVSSITSRPLNRIRKRQNLPLVGREGFTSAYLNLIPVSPAVYSPNPHWEPQHHVVGYWFVEEPREWQPPQELLTFLETGSPPLVVSLGAMSLGSADAQASADLFVRALQQAGLRGIIQGWGSGIKQLVLPTTIYAAGALPHGWLLPRCAGMVHHGGFGSTSAALRAGIPTLVIPHMVDQFYWAQRVHELGLGPVPTRRTKLESSGLAAKMVDLVQNIKYSDAAANLGNQIRAENGIENAIRLIEATFS